MDIDAGAALVEAIKPLARSTRRPGAEASLGGFGAWFDLAAAGYRDPLLVATTDGVGTKLKIAIDSGKHDTIGVDLVAMCVNDLVVQGAEPLLFLDYYASGKLDLGVGRSIVAGIAHGCRIAGCALVGGETAEMPGLYAKGDYDLAGFALGAVERGRAIDGANVAAGDAVIGLASSGVHSNGFSLVRRIVEESGMAPSAPSPFAAGRTLAEALLEPTRIYVASCLALARAGLAKALAHITGGGLVENIPRALPDNVTAEIDARRWPLPPVFAWLAESGKVAPAEMARVFNCGVGMAIVVAAKDVGQAMDLLRRAGETPYEIGRIAPRPPGGAGCVVLGADEAWRR